PTHRSTPPRLHQYLPLSPASSVFFLPVRQPPRPPLFPYTTLFRSVRHWRDTGYRRSLDPDFLPIQPIQFICNHFLRQLGEGRKSDRKSTRLNSSHGSISYAVFCLKKNIRYSTEPYYRH